MRHDQLILSPEGQSLISSHMMNFDVFVETSHEVLLTSVVRKYKVPLAMHTNLKKFLRIQWEVKWKCWKESLHDLPSTSQDMDFYYASRLFEDFTDHVLNNSLAQTCIKSMIEDHHEKNKSACFAHAIEKEKQEVVRKMVRRSIATAVFKNVDMKPSSQPAPVVSHTDHEKEQSIEAGKAFDKRRAELAEQHTNRIHAPL